MARGHVNLGLHTVKALVVLDSEGKRMLSKYYSQDYPSIKEQKAFEKALFEKTKTSNCEIIMFDGHVVVFKNSIDVFIYVVGSPDENELILMSVMQAYYDALGLLLKTQVEKRAMNENLDVALLALDETIDDGIILESDPTQISSRVTRRSDEAQNIPLAEQTISQALQSARDQLTRTLLK
ncbi:hypothetical protein SeMB42_g00577 [Synchytrium endobioticum]|uniref:Coatomer subunit zeta n=1 Tax=Synchytrium endobioticum TaxID=286115 RepID=A0A507DRM2_9FUNG|nr:hypothetical protein SeLEV6574_g01140 [Synchytrium endobioticum]TPX53897.1 hypothetical protein SeMB42_g00577 [Synchytrium endobioticum]